MTDLPTHGVLSVTTGRLVRSMDGIYEVASFLVGRPMHTHELAYYADRMRDALLGKHPRLPGACAAEDLHSWRAAVDAFLAENGERFTPDPSLAGSLADKETAMSTLLKMTGNRAVEVVDPMALTQAPAHD